MKKIFLSTIIIGACLALSGCGNSANNKFNSTDDEAINTFVKAPVASSIISYVNETATTTPTATPKQNIDSNNLNNQKPMQQFDASKHYTAVLKTSKGDIEIALNFGQTPNTVKNFVDLSRKNFYDNTIFHRVIKGFMIQGGDPKGDGTGGPGYRFNDEEFTGEYTRGTVAMANAGPNTNGSQFFIMHADAGLPKNYVIFGHVVKGMEVVDAIAESKITYSSTGEASKPIEPTVVKSVLIEEK